MYNSDVLWYSTYLGRKESDGLFNTKFERAWIWTKYYGADMNDDFAAYIGGGEPYSTFEH